MKHCIIALKASKTPHDVAELSLYTFESFAEKINSHSIFQIPQYENDAINIHLFLTEHLPDETLIELKKLLFPKSKPLCERDK